MRVAHSPDELCHVAVNAAQLQPEGRVRVLYPNYVMLEGIVLATHHRAPQPGARSLSVTIRTDDDRVLEVDLLEVEAIHRLKAR